MTASLCLLAASSLLAADGLFTEHSQRYTIGANAVDIVAVDLTGDGLPEIVTADVGRMSDPREEAPAHSQLSLLLAKGDLRYEAQPQLRTGFAPYCIYVANIDVLKAPDLIVASFLASRNRDVSVIRNVGDQVFETFHFEAPDEVLDYHRLTDGDGQPVFTTPGMTSVAVRDFDGDGYRDVIATGWSSDVLVFFPGTDEPYLGTPRLIPAPGGPRDIEIADLNGDGHSDLAVAMYSTHEVAIWQGDGTGQFEPAVRFSARGKLPQRIELADINGDGETDIAVSNRHADDSVVLFFGEGDFEFSVSQEIALGEDKRTIEYEIVDMIVSDLDGDGRPDIAAAGRFAGKVTVLLNRSSGASLPQMFEREEYLFEDEAPSALCVADFNADGAKDLGVALGEAHEVALLLGRAE